MLLLILQIGGRDRSKRIFWIDGGIHAREWAAPHTALYFIHQVSYAMKASPSDATRDFTTTKAVTAILG